VTAVMVLSAWALAGFYGREELFRRANTDPFHIGSQFDRFREAAKVLPEGAMLAYVSDAPSHGVEDAAAFLETQYVLAPRLLVELDDKPVVEWVLGDFGAPADYTAFAKTHGLNVVKDFGRGIVVFRRKAR
jgi:hypothetical protein